MIRCLSRQSAAKTYQWQPTSQCSIALVASEFMLLERQEQFTTTTLTWWGGLGFRPTSSHPSPVVRQKSKTVVDRSFNRQLLIFFLTSKTKSCKGSFPLVFIYLFRSFCFVIKPTPSHGVILKPCLYRQAWLPWIFNRRKPFLKLFSMSQHGTILRCEVSLQQHTFCMISICSKQHSRPTDTVSESFLVC